MKREEAKEKFFKILENGKLDFTQKGLIDSIYDYFEKENKIPTLREIDFEIRDSFLRQGKKLDGTWRFEVGIVNAYKNKKINVVYFEDTAKGILIYSNINKNSDELFKEIYAYFNNKKYEMPKACPKCGSNDLYDPNPTTDPIGPYCDDCGESIKKIEVKE